MKITNKHIGHAMWMIPVMSAVTFSTVKIGHFIIHQADKIECGSCWWGIFLSIIWGGFAVFLFVLLTIDLLDGTLKFEINIPIGNKDEQMTEEERELFEEWLKERDETIS